MTKDRLQSLSYSSLKELAKKTGITGFQNMETEKLMEAIIEALEEERNERIVLNSMAVRSEEKKFDIFRDEEISTMYDDEYHIPDSYNHSRVQMILVEPLLAYAFWDLSDKDRTVYMNTAKPGRLMLRIHEKTCPCEENGELPDFFDIPVKLKDSSWYINLPAHNSCYYIELIQFMYGEEKILCTSNTIKSPFKTVEDIESSSEFINEDILLLTGVYDFGVGSFDDRIPQRIISFLDDKYLEQPELVK